MASEKVDNNYLISFRLNSDYPHEAEALEIYKRLTETHDARSIFTDALLRMEGITPEMFDIRKPSQFGGILASIYAEIRQQGENFREMLLAIKNVDPDAFRALADSESGSAHEHAISEELANALMRVKRESWQELDKDE